MFKKGLITLVCLAAMTALAAWAATSYLVVTKVSNTGGVIVARGVTQSTASTVYRTYTTAAAVPMSVARNAGYRISALAKNGVAVPLGNYTANYATTFVKSTGTSQSLTATFAAIPVPTPPATTYTWQMQTQINSASGKITTVRDGVTVDLTKPNLLVTKNYTDTVGAALPVTATITADPGYKISSVATTGTVATNDGTVATVTGIPATGLLVNYVTANFAPKSLTVTDPTGATSVTVYGGSTSMVITPTGTNTTVSTITLAGPATLTLADKNGNPVALPFAGPVTATLSNITGNVTVSASYSSNTYDAMKANCDSCHPTASSASVRAVFGLWSASTHRTVGTDCVTCHQTMPGSVTVSAVSATNFTFTADGSNYCATCHAPAASFQANLSASAHTAKTCSGCHSTVHNPDVACATCHTTESATFALSGHGLNAHGPTCEKCHTAAGTGDAHLIQAGVNAFTACGTAGLCHNGVSPYAAPKHFSNISASYVAKHQPIKCANCHFNFNQHNLGAAQVPVFLTNTSVMASWAASGHGDTNAGAWKISSSHKWDTQGSVNGDEANAGARGCVRCHTPEGFLRWTGGLDKPAFTNTTSWNGTVSDARNGAVLGCYGCHNEYTGTVRQIGAVTVYYNYSSTATGFKGKVKVSKTYPDVGSSNTCVSCHSGRQSVDTINALAAKFGNLSGSSLVIGQHDAPAALTVFANLYNASPFVPTLTAAHDQIGVNNTNNTGNAGPCATCHGMSGSNHSLEADADGAVCAKCHIDMSSTKLSAAQAEFNDSVTVMRKVLRFNGYSTYYQYGGIAFSTNDKKKMNAQKLGMAQSIAQLTLDAGAFAHNPAYVRKIVSDAIDIFDDGKLNGSTSTTLFKNMTSAAKLGSLYGTSTVVNAQIFVQQDRQSCEICHSSTLDPSSGNAIVAEYNLSGHALNGHGPGCAGCHVPGTTVAHPGADEAATPSMLVGYSATGVGGKCITCHNGVYSKQFDGVTHFTNATTATFHNVSAAYVGYKGKGINVCATCHFKFDPHTVGAATTQTFTTNSDILSAWAESGHGERSASPWIPSSGHDWRNSGSTVNFQTNIPASDCVRCHTAAGFSQFVDSKLTNVTNVGAADGQRFNSPLTCAACHQVDATGSTIENRRVDYLVAGTVYGDGKTPNTTRGIGVTTFYNISTVDKVTKRSVKARVQADFPDVGESNLCNTCHTARLSGAALVTAVNNGLSLNNSGFQNSHYMGASGMMYMKAGFINFTSTTAAFGTSTYGKSLTSSLDMTGGVSSTHRNLGTKAINGDSHNTGFFVTGNLDTNGPCVTCHMKGYTNADTDRPAAGHSLEINADAYGQVCINCHTTEGSATGPVALTAANFLQNFVEPNQSAYQASLALAVTLLHTNYQIKYDSASYPYFYDENNSNKAMADWTRGGRLNAAAALKLEGACFNINLLSREPAAFVHSRSYTRRLVYDTIDFLDDGVINQSVATSAHNVDPTNFTAGAVAYTDGTLGTFGTGTTEGMLYLRAWNRTTGTTGAAGTWTPIQRP